MRSRLPNPPPPEKRDSNAPLSSSFGITSPHRKVCLIEAATPTLREKERTADRINPLQGYLKEQSGRRL
jgi:hypothetical protein